MYCKKCGREIYYNSNFCQYCGTPQDMVAPNPVQKTSEKGVSPWVWVILIIAVLIPLSPFLFILYFAVNF